MTTFALAGCDGSSGGDKAASGNNGSSKSDAILLDLTNSEFYDADATTDKTRGDFVHKIPGSTYGICVEKNTVTVGGEETPSYRTILELNNDKDTEVIINNANLGVHGDLYTYWVVKPEATDLTTVIFSMGKSEAEAKTIVASFLPEKGYFYGWSEDRRVSLHKDDYTPIEGVASSFDGKILKVGDKGYELTSEYTIAPSKQRAHNAQPKALAAGSPDCEGLFYGRNSLQRHQIAVFTTTPTHELINLDANWVQSKRTVVTCREAH